MKNRKILGLLCCAFVEVIFVSCAQNLDHGHPEAKYGLEISPEDDTLEFSELYSSYDFVRLKNAMVSDVTDVVALDSIYIVRCSACGADENPEHCSMVSIFSKEGEYLAPLIYQGRGPEEVLTIEDMCYNDMSGTFDVLCNYGQYIYRYDLSERKPVVKIALDQDEIISAEGLSPVSEDEYLVYKKYPAGNITEYKLYLFNAKTGIVEARFLEMDKKLSEKLAFGQKNNLIEADGDIYYYAAFEPAIYRFSEDSLTQYVKFIENRYSIPMNFLENLGMDLYNTIQELRQSPYIWGNVNMYYYSGYFMSTYTYSDRKYLSVLNPEQNLSHSYSAIKDDMAMGIVTENSAGVYTIAGADSNGVCYVIEPYLLKEIISGTEGPYTEARRQIMSAADDMNPMLLIMH